MNPTHSHLPLAKAFTTASLPGALRKYFEVPAGRQGIVILRSGRVRLLTPGRYIVAVTLPRIIWSDNGDTCGYIPAGDFPGFYKLSNLLSGDGELVDASLLCTLKVSDAQQFFQNVVHPMGEVLAAGLELPAGLLCEGLEPLVRRYAAGDLSAGLPTDFLLGQVGGLVRQQLAGMGLSLVAVQVFSFLPVLDRLELAAKLAGMEAMLADAQVQNRFEAAQDQDGADGAMRELQKTTSIPAGVRPILAEKKQPGGLVENLKKWLGIHPAEPHPQSATRLQKLLEDDATALPVRAGMRLENLAFSSPGQIDVVVRRQVERELEHIQSMLTDCRSKLYRNGDETSALAVMKLLHSLEKRRVQCITPTFAQPVYASGLAHTREQLGAALAYDEGLLVQIGSHSEYAHILQQKVTAADPVDEDIRVLASRLDTFEHAFSRRARLLRAA